MALPTVRDDKTAPRTDKANDSLATQLGASLAGHETLGHDIATRADNTSAGANENLFERYQALIAGALMFVTALSIIFAVGLQKRRDKRDETRAVAAALRAS